MSGHASNQSKPVKRKYRVKFNWKKFHVASSLVMCREKIYPLLNLPFADLIESSSTLQIQYADATQSKEMWTLVFCKLSAESSSTAVGILQQTSKLWRITTNCSTNRAAASTPATDHHPKPQQSSKHPARLRRDRSLPSYGTRLIMKALAEFKPNDSISWGSAAVCRMTIRGMTTTAAARII